jgi:hypothetical protein
LHARRATETAQTKQTEIRQTEAGASFIRAVAARAYSHVHKDDPVAVLQRHYASDEVSPLIVRAASSPASISGSGWASQLAQTGGTDFLYSLGPIGVAGLQLLRGRRAIKRGRLSAVIRGRVAAEADFGAVLREPVPPLGVPKHRRLLQGFQNLSFVAQSMALARHSSADR